MATCLSYPDEILEIINRGSGGGISRYKPIIYIINTLFSILGRCGLVCLYFFRIVPRFRRTIHTIIEW